MFRRCDECLMLPDEAGLCEGCENNYREIVRLTTLYESETRLHNEAADEIERLQLQTQLQADELRRRQIRIVALESGND